MRSSPGLWVFGLSLVAISGLVVMIRLRAPQRETSTEPLVVHVAAALKTPLSAIAKAYEKETGQKLELRYGPSQTLLTNIEQGDKSGDLFLPADDSYIGLAKEKDLIAETLPLAKLQAVLLVNKSVEKPIVWKDLLDPSFKLAQTNPKAGAIGKLTRDTLTKSKQWDELEANTKTFSGTVVDAANAAKLGSVDGAIVWDAMAPQYSDLRVVKLPELDAIQGKVQVAIVKSSKRSAEALRFARYVTAPNKGHQLLKKAGFENLEPGDVYADQPRLMVMAGAMLRPAIEKSIAEFEQREGVEIARTFNGCGILVGTMETGAIPDLFFACDPRFMDQVQQHFTEPVVVSGNQLVIAVAKGNPHQLKELKDLGKEGLKVGVGHEQQCALGTITQETFIKTGLYKKIRENVKSKVPAGDLLVNQLLADGLDAVVIYQSNLTPNLDKIDGFQIKGIDCAPLQPVAVKKDSPNRQLAQRLMNSLQTPLSRKRFEELGFRWELKY